MKMRMKKLILTAAAFALTSMFSACASENTADKESGTQGCDVFEECGNTEDHTVTDFRTAYESLNGTLSSSGDEIRSVFLPEDPAFVPTAAKTVLGKILNGDTFWLYIGDEMCPWCRSVIETAARAAAEAGVHEIRYIEIWNEDGCEIFRDKYIAEDGKAIKSVEGTITYDWMISKWADVLEDYTLDCGDSIIETGEKRIFVPAFFYIEHGNLKGYTTGISPKQETSDSELTEEILADETEMFRQLFDAGR